MATNLRILGWKSSGFRSPDHELSFIYKEDEVYPISLIQMPNWYRQDDDAGLAEGCIDGVGGEMGTRSANGFSRCY